ncbi:unnamed protein product [Brassicogethes aeneus]|uniref:Peptidase S1 domain-containing protein n=1 Tax=Brassicogethes aeneus TaxID=1431903 RepID=A0A9P0FM83_BRAAE|nr:unnamed protein product [Brassicogethes aeneus]
MLKFISLSILLINFKTCYGIINGYVANIHDDPYVGQLVALVPIPLTVGDRYGQVVAFSPKYAVTVCHLVQNSDPSAIGVGFGSPYQYLVKVFTISTIRCHEDFAILTNSVTQYAINDIAILKLTEPLPNCDTIQPIPLCISEPADNTALITLGWGAFVQLDLPVLGTRTLNSLILLSSNMLTFNNSIYQGIINEGHICAFSTSGQTPCGGDSGGPLAGKTLFGLTSFSISCGTTQPTVFTNVCYYEPWINANMIP